MHSMMSNILGNVDIEAWEIDYKVKEKRNSGINTERENPVGEKSLTGVLTLERMLYLLTLTSIPLLDSS